MCPTTDDNFLIINSCLLPKPQIFEDSIKAYSTVPKLTAPPTLAAILFGQFRVSCTFNLRPCNFTAARKSYPLAACHIDFLALDLVARLQIDTGSTRSSCCGVGCVFENSL